MRRDGLPEPKRYKLPIFIQEAAPTVTGLVEVILASDFDAHRAAWQTQLERLRAVLERSNKFLAFCADRLEHVYGESPNVDYLLHARKTLEGK